MRPGFDNLKFKSGSVL